MKHGKSIGSFRVANSLSTFDMCSSARKLKAEAVHYLSQGFGIEKLGLCSSDLVPLLPRHAQYGYITGAIMSGHQEIFDLTQISYEVTRCQMSTSHMTPEAGEVGSFEKPVYCYR